jgi:hypothetical protein
MEVFNKKGDDLEGGEWEMISSTPLIIKSPVKTSCPYLVVTNTLNCSFRP